MTRRSRLISGLGWVLVCGLGLTSVWSQTTRKPVGPPTDASRKKTAAPVADDPFSEPGPTTSVSPAGSDLKADPDDPDFAVIQPWLSSVVTIRWHEPQPGAPKLELKTQGGIVVDPRGYIVTLPFRNVDNGADDLNDPGTNGQERSIRVRFSAGTEYNAQLVDNEPHVLAILKVDLPRPCPSIDLTRVREPVDRERVFLVPQQLSQRTLMGRVTTISANFGDGTPPLVGCGMRIPKTDAGSLLVSEQGHPLGIVTVLTGKVPSYALPLESAKEYIGRRIAENEEDEQRRARRRPLPPETPQRIDRTSGRDPLATESLPQWEQLAKHESQAAAHARVIRDLQTRKIPDGDSMLKENRRLLRDQLNQAFDLKAQIEERRLQEFRSRLDRLEQQIGQRKALRDKIVDRRATELIDGEAVHWNHPLPDESSLPPRDVPSEPAGETPFLPDGRLPPTDDLTLPTPRSPIGQPDNAPVDPLRARAPTAPPFEDVSPPIRSSATPHELVPFEEADAPAENAGTKLSVHLRPAVDPQGEPQAKPRPASVVKEVQITGRSLKYNAARIWQPDQPKIQVATFEPLQPGHYSLDVALADGQIMTRPLVIRGDKPLEVTVECPPPREPATLLVTLPPLPAEFRIPGIEYWLRCSVAEEPVPHAGYKWKPADPTPQELLFDPETGKATKMLRSVGEEFVETDLTALEEENRVLFVTSGQVTAKVVIQIVSQDSRNSKYAIQLKNPQQESRAIVPGENVWKFEYQDETLKQIRETLYGVKKEIRKNTGESQPPSDDTP